MLIAYVFHIIEGPESGVFKKILDQAREWINNDVDVALFILTHKGFTKSFVDAADGIPTSVYEYSGIAERLRKVYRLYDHVISYSASIVYYRYDIYYPTFEEFARTIPVVMEINSDDISEFRLGNRFRHWFNYITRRRIFWNVKGLILESHQLSKAPHFARFGKPCLVLGNGINLKRFAYLRAPGNSKPAVAFIGSAHQPWHGVDKIIWLAEHFKDWRFDLIGPDRSDFKTIPRNVIMHGFLNQVQYEPLLARADVALGPLSLHLINKEESSPLKVREYLAYGIPTILAYKDTDFPDGAPFLLQIGNRPDNVINNVSEIEEFVISWRGKRISRDAISRLDVSVKEKERLLFLDRFARRPKGRDE